MHHPITSREVLLRSGVTHLGAALALICAALLAACQRSAPDSDPPPAHERAPVLSEYVPTPSPDGPTKRIGDDCTAHGASECVSGTCLHVSPKPGEGYVCSRTCTATADCPPGWTCSSLLPAPASALCLPPRS